ncbi:hypothetical protein GALMADRAFT_1321377 [Galerina marginata CBS 339.88]|uniref:Small EDRK-rich factor-like N-terminal domain-containing protein n=1 Tax=Galerina marginata (strain CBS 339.88) TaxID=685588 RepID=A0A067TQZ4_GALM3|nr:hypothetical protein GALMADRAFT_1321377 [Galerina marginata CBS 339.88]
MVPANLDLECHDTQMGIPDLTSLSTSVSSKGIKIKVTPVVVALTFRDPKNRGNQRDQDRLKAQKKAAANAKKPKESAASLAKRKEADAEVLRAKQKVRVTSGLSSTEAYISSRSCRRRKKKRLLLLPPVPVMASAGIRIRLG